MLVYFSDGSIFLWKRTCSNKGSCQLQRKGTSFDELVGLLCSFPSKIPVEDGFVEQAWEERSHISALFGMVSKGSQSMTLHLTNILQFVRKRLCRSLNLIIALLSDPVLCWQLPSYPYDSSRVYKVEYILWGATAHSYRHVWFFFFPQNINFYDFIIGFCVCV